MTMTPNAHEKAEWSRMAQAAYASGLNTIGHIYSAAASAPEGRGVGLYYFYRLQAGYRAWLCDGRFPA